ncbi:formate dehydrogenase subunit delta [Martelella mediterranea]|uniref:NADH-dependent formate dehydrogenase delta subunit FdsD n=1 Tax=Martelella mediterranea DSM 17316 TaxID=1122214 RepID=A0A1U9YZ19_9HYPH|nr:formate dehydrogenase subunit delta [Martelella mediterranea]AQZ50687.1 NADH-dependent formate dehydrogenase delta subunit FdsD [Martelella mediterranea DSM 17316]
MAPEKLTHMANQIAAFFRTRPHDEAVAGVADHISKFWEPRMRAQLFEMLQQPGSGFDPLVIEAGDRIRPVAKQG